MTQGKFKKREWTLQNKLFSMLYTVYKYSIQLYLTTHASPSRGNLAAPLQEGMLRIWIVVAIAHARHVSVAQWLSGGLEARGRASTQCRNHISEAFRLGQAPSTCQIAGSAKKAERIWSLPQAARLVELPIEDTKMPTVACWWWCKTTRSRYPSRTRRSRRAVPRARDLQDTTSKKYYPSQKQNRRPAVPCAEARAQYQ